MMATADELFARALDFHRAGEREQAETLLQQTLALNPRHVDAWHYAGLLAQERGAIEEAIRHIEQAIALFDQAAVLHNNLGHCWLRLQRLAEAEVCFRRALELDARLGVAWGNLGRVHRQRQELSQSVACFERAVEFDPSLGSFYGDLAEAWMYLGRADAAVTACRQQLALAPQDGHAWNNLGSALQAAGRLDEAAAAFESASRIQPDLAFVHANLGGALRRLRRYDESLAAVRRAAELVPNSTIVLNNLGNVLADLGRLDEAERSYRQAIDCDPNHASAFNNLGTTLHSLNRLGEAVACLEQAVALQPDFAEAHKHLADALLDLGQRDRVAALYQRAWELKPAYRTALSCLVYEKQQVCSWDGLEALTVELLRGIEADEAPRESARVSPFACLSLIVPTNHPQQLTCASTWARGLLPPGSDTIGPPLARRPRIRKSRLRIGYLSADFRDHPIAYLIAELLETHDRERVTVVVLSFSADDGSAIRQRTRQACDEFLDLERDSFLESAQKIAAAEIDILVDLTGYTQFTRTEILAHRPAPIQVNWLGFPGTMGAPFVDYIVVDEHVVPAAEQPFFAERLVHLPGSYQVNDSRRVVGPTPTRAACGLPEKDFVFCCFNNNYKITPSMFDVWMRLLTAVPGSVLWLLEGNRWAVANLRHEAERRGVAAERLIFAPRVPAADHLARQQLADLFLDTLPYNAHVTASDALWVGLPVLTLVGSAFCGRVASSLLHTLGLPELIATSLAEYESRALELARDPAPLAVLRARLQANRHRCGQFDGARFARQLERAYAAMWERYAAGLAPAPLRIEADNKPMR